MLLGHDNQVKKGFLGEQFTLHTKGMSIAPSEKFKLDVRFPFA